MRLLLDECVSQKLKDVLPGHEVGTAGEMGWSGAQNGELLALMVLRTVAAIRPGTLVRVGG